MATTIRKKKLGRISFCSRFQTWFLGLVCLWMLYVMGIIFTAVHVHKLDPTKPQEDEVELQHQQQQRRNNNIDNLPHDDPIHQLHKVQQLQQFEGEKRTRKTTRKRRKQEEISPHIVLQQQSMAKAKLDQLQQDNQDELLKESIQKQVQERIKLEQALKTGKLQKKIHADIKSTSDKKQKMLRPGYRPEPYGHMVKPQVLLQSNNKNKEGNPILGGNHNNKDISYGSPPKPRKEVLKAYLEPIDQSLWDIKPLPVRTVAADQLTEIAYPKLNSCKRLPEQWPVDDYPDADPFLPWIHDVFPTDDGTRIQFVAQNKRRCHTGTTEQEEAILKHTAPQVALFEHVALKRLNVTTTGREPRFRLSSHQDADYESMSTRFICRFKPTMEITFARHNNDYEWVALRKRHNHMFSPDGRDLKQVHTSQLMFYCPVPESLVETIRTGASVHDDWATIFLDLIPIRTPPRYGPPNEFLVPWYEQTLPESYRCSNQCFNTSIEWGEHHILPKIADSGRWENIPICQPSLMTYEPEVLKKPDGGHGINHHLVSCLWASTGYTTRGNRFAVNDGQRRLLEWITFNKILGFDHFYIYDNSGAFTNESSLQPFVDLFPGEVTVINWPSRVCNNNPNNVDSPGERSSQYAAETSCRLRFGPHVKWIGQFDIGTF